MQYFLFSKKNWIDIYFLEVMLGKQLLTTDGPTPSLTNDTLTNGAPDNRPFIALLLNMIACGMEYPCGQLGSAEPPPNFLCSSILLVGSAL